MNVLNLIHTLCLLEFARQIILGYVNEPPYLCETLHCFGKLSKFIDMQVKCCPVVEKGCHYFTEIRSNKYQTYVYF